MEDNNYKGCLMLKFEIPIWDELLQRLILPTDVYDNEEKEYGLEHEPHVTVLYGIRNDVSMDDLSKYLIPTKDLRITFKSRSIFSNDYYDVVKFDVECEQLNNINNALTDNIHYTNDYPDYHAHVTIAYLKKGTGEKYIKDIEEFVLIPECYKYNNYINGVKQDIMFDVEPNETN